MQTLVAFVRTAVLIGLGAVAIVASKAFAGRSLHSPLAPPRRRNRRSQPGAA